MSLYLADVASNRVGAGDRKTVESWERAKMSDIRGKTTALVRVLHGLIPLAIFEVDREIEATKCG